MPDHARRAHLVARAKDLRSKVESLISKCHDERVKRFVKRSVTNWVDDVEGFWLGHHPDEHSESTWLTNAERVLTAAENAYETIVVEFDELGGPALVRLIGG